MSDRERFEAWAVRPPREWSITRSGSKDAWPGQYVYHVQCAWETWQAACPEGWQCVPVELIDWVRGAQELMREMPGDWPATANQADMLLSAAPKPEDAE